MNETTRMCRGCFRPLHWDPDKDRNTGRRDDRGAWVHEDGNQWDNLHQRALPIEEAR